MTLEQISEWVQAEFSPVELVTPYETILQLIRNALRYFNTRSAIRTSQMMTVNAGSTLVTVDHYMKTVVKVLPTPPAEWITQNYPQWSLLGISMLDSVNNDLIMMTEAFKNYKGYIGGDFKWYFERSTDPAIGGQLHMYNLPQNVSKVFVLGTKQYNEDDDIVDDQVLVWLLPYAKALVKQAEGNSLRKSSAIGVNNDGQALYNEGKEEMEVLQKQLFESGRWVAFTQKF